jgi:DNA modification methylase
VSPALPDYLLVFKKPGERPAPVKTDVTNEEWIEWARPIWYSIKESNTLNARAAREKDDERHLTPLQLDFIERCVRLWSNPGETVFSAFGGVGSELYVAVKWGRRALGIELKPSYWSTGCQYLTDLEHELAETKITDHLDEVPA